MVYIVASRASSAPMAIGSIRVFTTAGEVAAYLLEKDKKIDIERLSWWWGIWVAEDFGEPFKKMSKAAIRKDPDFVLAFGL